MSMILDKIESILKIYTDGEHYETLKLARDTYIEKTAQIDSDSPEYESRMNSFNDWYLFNFKKDNGDKAIVHYLNNNNEEEVVSSALLNVNYSLFLFHKINFRKQVIIKDLLHDKKFILSRDNTQLALVEDDLFVGRMITHEDQNYLLNGLCLLPRDILSTLKKEAKKVRKMNNIDEEELFLLNLERLKTKALQYTHVEASKIFTF